MGVSSPVRRLAVIAVRVPESAGQATPKALDSLGQVGGFGKLLGIEVAVFENCIRRVVVAAARPAVRALEYNFVQPEAWLADIETLRQRDLIAVSKTPGNWLPTRSRGNESIPPLVRTLEPVAG